MYLPRCETGRAHQVPTWLNLHVFIVLGTDFAQLKRRTHLTVQLVLLLKEKKCLEGQTQAFAFCYA